MNTGRDSEIRLAPPATQHFSARAPRWAMSAQVALSGFHGRHAPAIERDAIRGAVPCGQPRQARGVDRRFARRLLQQNGNASREEIGHNGHNSWGGDHADQEIRIDPIDHLGNGGIRVSITEIAAKLLRATGPERIDIRDAIQQHSWWSLIGKST